ncbi:hypothetical protein N782_17995 [Pontibacillus yanchengensis Y32]|uniref:Uncharacterized protein n=1 Tax=Pontibacillus yanchengensis Y32 TaxID=1385514 RepID=A0A0A2T736_9BACI|nr:hypothetical protein N782_17995 [Pontibacillus yanchengensis Y32]
MIKFLYDLVMYQFNKQFNTSISIEVFLLYKWNNISCHPGNYKIQRLCITKKMKWPRPAPAPSD